MSSLKLGNRLTRSGISVAGDLGEALSVDISPSGPTVWLAYETKHPYDCGILLSDSGAIRYLSVQVGGTVYILLADDNTQLIYDQL